MAGSHYSAVEARQKIKALLPHEWHKVVVYSRFLITRSRTPRDPTELQDEAVLRTIDGRRRWKIGMDGPSHLFGVMKSILHSWNKADVHAETAISKITSMEEHVRDVEIGDSDAHLAAELRQGLERLQNDKKLNSDERAVVTALLKQESHEGIISLLSNDTSRYKRILRSLAAYLTMDGGEQEVTKL